MTVRDPEDTGLAGERTALAWTRTGLSFGVAGAVLLRLLHGTRSAVLAVAVGFVCLGSVAWLWGWGTPDTRPAVGSRLGRAAVTTLGVGTAALALAGAVVQVT